MTPTSSVYLTGEPFVSPRWSIALGYELPEETPYGFELIPQQKAGPDEGGRLQ